MCSSLGPSLGPSTLGGSGFWWSVDALLTTVAGICAEPDSPELEHAGCFNSFKN